MAKIQSIDEAFRTSRVQTLMAVGGQYNRKERSLIPTLRRPVTLGLSPLPLLVDTMLKLTFSFDAPLEANRISSEDILTVPLGRGASLRSMYRWICLAAVGSAW
jgi:hypothetical protein